MRGSLRDVCGITAAAAVTITTSLSFVVAAGTAGAAAIPHFKPPKVYGTHFQSDPHHDFTKHISPRHDGILRGWVVNYSKSGVAEYKPIRWVKGKPGVDGFFTDPPEGDVTAYASKVSSKAVLYSVSNCDPAGTKPTVDRHGLGAKRCSRKALLKHLKTGHIASLITIYHGRIVKIQEISAG